MFPLFIVSLYSFANGRMAVQSHDDELISSEMSTSKTDATSKHEILTNAQGTMEKYIRKSHKTHQNANKQKLKAYDDVKKQSDRVRNEISNFKKVDVSVQTAFSKISWPDPKVSNLFEDVEEEFESCLKIKKKHQKCSVSLTKAVTLNQNVDQVIKKFNDVLKALKSLKNSAEKIRSSAKSVESAKKNLQRKKQRFEETGIKVIRKNQGDLKVCRSLEVHNALEETKGIFKLTF